MQKLVAVMALLVVLPGARSSGRDIDNRPGGLSLVPTVNLTCAIPIVIMAARGYDWTKLPEKWREVHQKRLVDERRQLEREKATHRLWVQRVTGLRDD
jgi:hypothetical protein